MENAKDLLSTSQVVTLYLASLLAAYGLISVVHPRDSRRLTFEQAVGLLIAATACLKALHMPRYSKVVVKYDPLARLIGPGALVTLEAVIAALILYTAWLTRRRKKENRDDAKDIKNLRTLTGLLVVIVSLPAFVGVTVHLWRSKSRPPEECGCFGTALRMRLSSVTVLETAMMTYMGVLMIRSS